MAQKTVGYVELEWTCPSCKGRNLGSAKICANCGAAMPDDITFALPAAQALDTSAATEQRVAAGPDIHCPYCGTRNPGDAKKCSQCGGDLENASKRAAGEVLGAHSTAPAPELTCPHCGAKNPGTALKCAACGGTLEKEPPPAPPPPPPQKKGCLPVLGIIALVVLCLGAFLLFRACSTTQDVVGAVKEAQWTYVIEVEALGPVTKEGWRDQLPTGAQVGRCEQKVRRTEDKPVPGAVEVCGTPYVVDTGTGKGKVTQDCVYQVSDSWCQYTVTAWVTAPKLTATGKDYDPKWPQFVPRTDQRERGRAEAYKVVLVANDKTYTYTPDTLAEYRRFQPGSTWKLKVNALGGVSNVQPAD
jgi:DNA-directed RNA polymerase subunit RPC12/RpoP